MSRFIVIWLMFAMLESSLFAARIYDDTLEYNEFVVSYKALVQNHILVGEEYNVSKTLQNTLDYEIVGICSFVDSSLESSTNHTDFNDSSKDFAKDSTQDSKNAMLAALRRNKGEILNCFSKMTHSKIRDDVKYINQAMNFDTRFSIAPQRILASFVDGKIRIKIIKRKI